MIKQKPMEVIYKPDLFIVFIDNDKNSFTFNYDDDNFAKIINLYEHDKWDDIRKYCVKMNEEFIFDDSELYDAEEDLF
jgi:hypothetical protein